MRQEGLRRSAAASLTATIAWRGVARRARELLCTLTTSSLAAEPEKWIARQPPTIRTWNGFVYLAFVLDSANIR